MLIPSPNVAENHQYHNAMQLQKLGAAVVVEEKELTGEKLIGHRRQADEGPCGIDAHGGESACAGPAGFAG